MRFDDRRIFRSKGGLARAEMTVQSDTFIIRRSVGRQLFLGIVGGRQVAVKRPRAGIELGDSWRILAAGLF